MSITLLAILGIAAMFVALLVIPLGLPGVWIMIAVLLVGTFGGAVSVGIFLLLLALAIGAEIAELVVVDKTTKKYGGSRLTFWGAMAGGIIGAVVGVPVPFVGSVIGVFVGTMVGAVLVTMAQSRELNGSVKAGWGAVVGRAAGAAIKVGTGLVILIIGGAALLIL